eukprot:s555_g4.t5
MSREKWELSATKYWLSITEAVIAGYARQAKVEEAEELLGAADLGLSAKMGEQRQVHQFFSRTSLSLKLGHLEVALLKGIARHRQRPMEIWPCCCDKDPVADGNEFVAQHRWREEDVSDDGFMVEFVAESSESLENKETALAATDMSRVTLSRRLKDVTLLRGTSLAHILRGAARELRSSKLTNQEDAERLYGQSRPVTRLDYFISHCWSDGRSGKLFALWIHSNLTPAMLISSAIALTCTVLCRARVLPVVVLPELGFEFFPWAFLFGYTSFFLVLASWQHMAPCVSRRQPSYFLDKFCVHQTDLELKHAGVASFAAFVSMSDCVLLLWSPTYFKRLWCMLEISALVKATLTDDLKSDLPLQFIPLELAKLSFYLWLTCFLVLLAVQINTVFNKPVPDSYFIAAVCVCAAYLQIAAFRQYARDRRFLAQQLQSFSVQHAMCSDLQDRSTIEATILSWFDTTDIEVCNRQIRQMVSEKVLGSLGPAQHYSTKLLLPVLLLHLFNNADYASGTWFDEDTFWRFLGPVMGFGVWMMMMVSWWAGKEVPLCFRLCHCFAMRRSNRCCDILLNMFLAAIVTMGWLGGWYVNYFFVGFLVLPGWSAVLLVLSECLLFLWLQRASFRRRTRGRSTGGAPVEHRGARSKGREMWMIQGV